MAIEINDLTFEESVLQAELPVLVDFWAPWCGPCRSLAPVIEALAEEYAGRVEVLKMNVDENQTVPEQLGIRAIPTLILFKNGKIVDQVSGALPKDAVKTMLDKVLA
ncbi:MAG: thioredoxin [Desulfovibrionaceae bacterium]|nr:thioredoxin [Desulfovibrionaceae bacterium]